VAKGSGGGVPRSGMGGARARPQRAWVLRRRGDVNRAADIGPSYVLPFLEIDF
jgi:hypothetical protein